ncbi:MAG: hypothetical protein ACP5RP_02090 [Candidatus Micrarchaeia archaeon]
MDTSKHKDICRDCSNNKNTATLSINKARLQSAIEYLTTYSWAILIIAVVLAALYSLGLFNASTYVQSVCSLPAGEFSCSNIEFNQSGTLLFTLYQNTQSPMNITGIGCGTNQTPKISAIKPQIMLQPGRSVTIAVSCYSGTTKYTGGMGSIFNGYLAINYTENNIPIIISGALTAKVNAPGKLSTSTMTTTSISTSTAPTTLSTT